MYKSYLELGWYPQGFRRQWNIQSTLLVALLEALPQEVAGLPDHQQTTQHQKSEGKGERIGMGMVWDGWMKAPVMKHKLNSIPSF